MISRSPRSIYPVIQILIGSNTTPKSRRQARLQRFLRKTFFDHEYRRLHQFVGSLHDSIFTISLVAAGDKVHNLRRSHRTGSHHNHSTQKLPSGNLRTVSPNLYRNPQKPPGLDRRKAVSPKPGIRSHQLWCNRPGGELGKYSRSEAGELVGPRRSPALHSKARVLATSNGSGGY